MALRGARPDVARGDGIHLPWLYSSRQLAWIRWPQTSAVAPSPRSFKHTGHASTRGLVPRNFKLVCEGAWLVVGNQESKTVASFAVDGASGTLRFVHELSTAPYKPCNISPYSELA